MSKDNKTNKHSPKGQEGRCVCGREGIRDARGQATCSYCYKSQKKYREMQVPRAVKERHYYVDDNYDIRRGDKILIDAALKAWETRQKAGRN